MAGSGAISDRVHAPPGWECCEINELVDQSRGISYGIVQPGSHDDAGVPILRVNNLRDGRIETNDVLRVSPAIEAKHQRTRLHGGEVLVSLVGTLGECAVVPPELCDWNVARAIAVIPLKRGVDPRWIAACLRSRQVQAVMQSWATTTVQATLNLRDVRRLPVLQPPPDVERAITSLVSSLDDKIEQNQRTARALEQLARAIFRAWFVDFEPVKAKAAGSTSFASMPQPIFDALPTTFTDSELGPIPDGWEVKPIGDAVSVKGGATPSTKKPEYWDEGIHCWATPKDMSRLAHPVLLDTERHITDQGVACISSGLLPIGTVLLSSRAPVGYLALAAVPTAINQGFIAMVCDGPLSPSYVLNWTHHVMDAIKARASGTTFPEISKRNFRPMPIVVPAPEAVHAFAEIVDPLFELITACMRENNRLAEMRDYLLPKLLSGQVHMEVNNG
jgi:type I restriction enzyme S subunit